ncbi:ribosome maturation factor RimM [Glycomyces sp. TRM65418]|uniref:ribosome maturation factor RimM n=1 Tax=Glycomyces sp. TRM65418 TaxID=2867006 RepID=UPI001CE5E3A6|nr:ribosome maturation factor RimM [Glycomyces sp. TRM65418]MCC3762410.1 ribosome maturation factor RimM [Glycomyces sp. TRM65418]QZD56455.1 ribosome maturation factor RimM [Glycomyces sp. TRM65418]
MPELVVGRIVRPHGLRGEVVVEVRTDDPETRFQPGVEYRTTGGRLKGAPLKAATVRWHQGRPMIGFEGHTDRNASELLRGVVLSVEIDEEELVADEDEVHDTLLIGLTVIDREAGEVGTVSRVDHGAAYETLVVKRKGRTPALIPFVADMIGEVDVEAGRIRVDLPPGLLEL